MTREQLITKLLSLEHRRSCLESDIAEKNSKLAAVIAAADFSEEKLQEIFDKANITRKSNGRNKLTPRQRAQKPIEPWALEIEVEYIISGK